MPEFTLEEARAQAVRAAEYFAEALKRHDEDVIAFKMDDCAIVVVRAPHAKRLVKAIDKDDLLGRNVKFEKPPKLKPKVTVGLIGLYHQPSDAYPSSKGSVHLHVMADVQIGRRHRRQGECLCSKKHGSRERMPQGETNVCGECRKVAEEFGLEWTL